MHNISQTASVIKSFVTTHVRAVGASCAPISSEDGNIKIALFLEFDFEQYILEWACNAHSTKTPDLLIETAVDLVSTMCDYFGVEDDDFQRCADFFLQEIKRQFLSKIIEAVKQSAECNLDSNV